MSEQANNTQHRPFTTIKFEKLLNFVLFARESGESVGVEKWWNERVQITHFNPANSLTPSIRYRVVVYLCTFYLLKVLS